MSGRESSLAVERQTRKPDRPDDGGLWAGSKGARPLAIQLRELAAEALGSVAVNRQRETGPAR
jgi:hypothetical protein